MTPRRRPTAVLAALGVAIVALLAGCFSWTARDARPSVGPQTTVVVLANFGDAWPRIRRPDRYHQFAREADRWLRAVSHGQAWLQGLDEDDGPITLLGPVDMRDVGWACDDQGFLSRAARHVLAHGEVRRRLDGRADEIDRLLFVLGGIPCTTAAGLGTSTHTLQIGSTRYRASMAYLKPTSRWGAFTHELLHGLGVGHALGYSCGHDPHDLRHCREVNGGHPLSLMGSAIFDGGIDVVQQETLGWVDCDQVEESGSYRLDALELAATSAPRCLKIPTDRGALYLEHRAYEGQDVTSPWAWHRTPNLYHGVLMYFETTDPDARQRPSHLLSMAQFRDDRPCKEEAWKTCELPLAALMPGETFTTPEGTRVTLTDRRAYSSYLTVELP